IKAIHCPTKAYFCSNIMCNNMIILLTGIKGEAIKININIEHLIKKLKANLVTIWERIDDLSTAIEYFQRIIKKFASEISTAY
ncbi:hypothetical protein CPB85DRAFT_1231534, partial [Mucidula mucida]